MLFNSFTFLFFIVFFLAVYFLVRRFSYPGSKYLTLAASYLFYSWAYPPYVFLLLFTTTVNFFCARAIGESQQPKRRKAFLLTSLMVSLGLLAWFKYTNFLLGSFQGFLGVTLAKPLNIMLPVGISFFTFHCLSYTIDVYRKRISHERDYLDFALYIAFFPQLVAGPIVLARDFLHQLKSKKKIVLEDVGYGLCMVVFGFFLKAVVADNLSIGVDNFYHRPEQFSANEAWYYVYSYALQIFGDFAGYSYIAIGLSRIMGYTLPRNFDYPYLSTSVTEFWRRWHISLSSWLKEYLYFSLGGNRKGATRMQINLMLTMLLGGLWHGASWNFVLWGGAHGLALVVEKQLMKIMPWFYASRNLLVKGIRWFLTFHFVVLVWVFFRAQTFGQTRLVFKQLFQGLLQPQTEHYLLGRTAFFMGVLVFACCLLRGLLCRVERFQQNRLFVYALVSVFFFFAWISLGINGTGFIYFQF